MLLTPKNCVSSPIGFQAEHRSETNSIQFKGNDIAKHPTSKNFSYQISKSVSFLYKIIRGLPVPILKLLFYDLVYPYINYGIEFWFGAPEYASNGVWVLQKRAVRKF